MYCAHWAGPHFHGFYFLPFIFFMFFLFFCFRMFRWGRRGRDGRRGWAGWWPSWCSGYGQDWTAGSWPDPSIRILDRRYANGEITREQYQQMKEDIEAGQSGDRNEVDQGGPGKD